MQRRNVHLPPLTPNVVYDRSGAPICQNCLSVMRPALYFSAYGIFATPDEEFSTRIIWRCAACNTEAVTA